MALGAERFTVRIRDATSGQEQEREWSVMGLKNSVAWLKRMNARGNDVYIRPAGEHGLVLLGDLTPHAIENMKRDGFAPAATLETSPGNFQAWVKLSDKPLPATTRLVATHGLAKHYRSNMDSADSQHYGRLAGFTNQKSKHRKNGLQPYVLAHSCPGNVAIASAAYLEDIERALSIARSKKDRKRRLEAIKDFLAGDKVYDPVHEYQRQAQQLMARYGDKVDLCRMDWMIATDMAKSRKWTQQDIETGIREASPVLENNKTGYFEDYARRTATKAWATPEVQAHRQGQKAPGMRRNGRSSR